MMARDDAKRVPVFEAAPAQTQELDPVGAFLKEAVSRGASSQEVAKVVATSFQDIRQMLTPIIGERGMAALYRRSLHLAGPSCAELFARSEAVPKGMDIALLEAELGMQAAEDAAAAGTALLQVFHLLLKSLIGQSLTERLLRSVWAKFLSGPSAGDTKP